ncbi:hypothetical protein GALL_135660 [mine drainage metagenome]|uniref:Uncharacterized protein n=1 Tax=mine drainage metagenome TaxID=410659 RepID=A0A1J5SWG1_9ZZZZ
MSRGRPNPCGVRGVGGSGALAAALAIALGVATISFAETSGPAGIVQTAVLDAMHPLFVPTHPRVATTIRFPGPIGAPEGRGFTEDEQRVPGEYLVTWSQGDSHLTLTPLEGAGPSNLNVPYQGLTYVLYFYPAASQFQAVASLSLRPAPEGGLQPQPPRGEAGFRGGHPGSTARWLGLIDRLKVLRAAAPGPPMNRIAAAFGLECLDLEPTSDASPGGHGQFRTQLLRVVRDAETNSLGFVVRIENTSDRDLAFDVSSFSARAGGIRLPQVLSDAPATLERGATTEAYFVTSCPANRRLTADNRWIVSVALSAPRINPAAAVITTFDGDGGQVSGAVP